MAYLGVTPTQEFSSVAKQSVTGDGSVSYTLNKGVSDANDLAVFVNDVRQEPGVAYTASGNTITFTANLESTDRYCPRRFLRSLRPCPIFLVVEYPPSSRDWRHRCCLRKCRPRMAMQGALTCVPFKFDYVIPMDSVPVDS